MAKISSVKIDKNQILKDTFKKKGLPELLSQVNFSIDVTDTSTNVIKKFVSAVKRTFKKEYFASKREEQFNFFNKVNIHDVYQVKIEELNSNDSANFIDYINRLVKRCSTLDGTSQTADVVKVIMTNGNEEYVGYSLLNGEIKSSYHRTTRAFSRNNRYGYLLLLDIPSLISETIVIQSLIKFTQDNKELVKYTYVRNRLHPTVGPKMMPKNEDFKRDFLAIADKYQFDYTDAKESVFMDNDASTFYGENIKRIGDQKEFIYDKHLHLIVAEFIKQSNYAKYKAKEEYDERSDYARAFQTKKAIKLSHQERMNKNIFLKRYGYVELDNDVDLKKFDIIEKNFEQLIKVVHIPVRKDYSFRIKKLGKHRAAGIFYPSVKTTIFDLNHPDAYMHECFHQIDYILGENTQDDCYSESMNFRAIYDYYKELVNSKVKSLPKDNSFRTVWEGKTKYNKSYYLKPTEVFARAGEIYISQKGLEPNSLFKEASELKHDPVYPMDDKFIKMITNFFDDLFVKVAELSPNESKNVVKKETKQRASSNLNKTHEFETHKHSEQLSLF